MVMPSWRPYLLGVLFLVLSGCAAEQPLLTRSVRYVSPPVGEPIFVVPFTVVMVPREVEEGIFDRLVDQLNYDLNAEGSGYEFTIVKRPLDEAGRAWLAERSYITGEMFGFVRDSGCCSTELRLRTRLLYYQPGSDAPTLTIDYPRLVLFDHDKSTLEIEQERLIADTVQTLAQRLEAAFLNR